MCSLSITASLLSYAVEMYYFPSCLCLVLQITHLSPPLLTLVTVPERGLQLLAAASLRARTSTAQGLCPGLSALPGARRVPNGKAGPFQRCVRIEACWAISAEEKVKGEAAYIIYLEMLNILLLALFF